MDDNNEKFSIFTESSESKGLLYDSYNFLNERITKFLDIIEDGIKKIKKDPINNDVDIREDITKFKNDIDISYSPSSINIREISKMKNSISKYRSKTDSIFKRYSKLRYDMAFGGDYIHGILMKSKAYSKDINPEHYDKINKNVRNVDRALDWVEKVLIDLFNMIDQDLNILTIVGNTYRKHKIYENSDDILDSSIYLDESSQSILTPSFLSELADGISAEASTEYDPPLPYDQLPDHLKNDPVHVWRAKHGIELIHKEPTLEELNRIWNNWQLMSDEQKIISDNESIRLFGMNNEDHYYALIREYDNINESYALTNIPDKLYFASPTKLENSISVTTDKGLFLTPYIGIASLFVIDRRKVMRQYFKNAFNITNEVNISSNYTIGYDEWNLADDELDTPLEIAHIKHNIPNVNQFFKGTSSGYIHEVDVSTVKDSLQLYVTKDANRELIYKGPLALRITNIIPHSINWEIRYDKKYCEEIGWKGSVKIGGTLDSFINCDSPDELLQWMNKIDYGWISKKDGKSRIGDDWDETDFYREYYLQSPKMLSKTKIGVCWDQTELERYWFNENKYNFMVFYMEIDDHENCPSHTFLVYETEDGFNWFEHSWGQYRGIHEYKTISACIRDIINKHQNTANDIENPVRVYKMPKQPRYGITCDEFMKYAKNEKNMLDIYDISNDIFNESSGYNCNKCGSNLDTINITDVSKKDYEKAKSEFPSWDGRYGKLGMMICPECGKHNYIITGNKRWDEGVDIMEDGLSWIAQYIKEEGEDPSAPPPLNDESQEEKKSMPKQTDARESDKNGVRRKKLYIAFIEWAKACNSKNTFGSIFDKDIFNVTYPFVPNDMRYFYRLANPILCVLSGDLTFFQVSELRKLNAKNSKINEMLIFAATPNDMRVFNIKDKKIYRGVDENGSLTLKEIIGDTFDLYIQNMIKQGDILNGPIEESYDMEFI